MNTWMPFLLTGQLANRARQCKCLNGYIGRINPQLIKAKPVIHHPSIFCPNTEIIITTKTNKEKCVDPESLLGKLILKTTTGKMSCTKAAVRMTTASPQTDTWSSTRVHGTSRV
uniref:Chemokine interleukin-8-like domain-containing protein n=1 Tax=Monopterus albus TaxID=43700 RepID=A0A3Q3J1E3_MONAL